LSDLGESLFPGVKADERRFFLYVAYFSLQELKKPRGGVTVVAGGTCLPPRRGRVCLHPRRGILGIYVGDIVTDHDKNLTLFQCLDPHAMSYEIISMR